MYKFVGKRCYFYVEKDGESYSEPFIANYTEFLMRNYPVATIKKHITAIHRFWLYSLFFPNDSWLELSMDNYLDEYQEVLKNGMVINKVFADDETGFKTKKVYYESKPLKRTGFEFEALEKYYKYLQDEDLNPNYDLSENHDLVIFAGGKDYKSLDRKAKYGKGSGYGLKVTGLAREALAEKVTVFSRFKKYDKQSNGLYGNRIFPFFLFDKLLEIADDRSKLLYLLCGAASARVGQALSLTKFDVDMRNKKVYLVDPTTNRVPVDQYGDALFEQRPRKELLADDYGIDFRAGKYKNIQFKYPIPVMSTTVQDLFFIQNKYRDMFFKTYARYVKTINDGYPMIFQTASNKPDNIWLPSNATDKLAEHIKKLQKMYSEHAKHLNLKNKYHSLRHMFGTYMANLAYLKSGKVGGEHTTRMPDLEIRNTIELYKEFTAKKMGHNDPGSVEIYFRTDAIVDSYVIQRIQEASKDYTTITATVIELREIDEKMKEGA